MECFIFGLFICLFSSTATAVSYFPQFVRNVARPQSSPTYKYETRYFTQTLDHFSFADLSTFQQRYLIGSDNWSILGDRGPIFFYCGNEDDVEWFAQNTGFVWEIAAQFGALVIFAEVNFLGFLPLFFVDLSCYSIACYCVSYRLTLATNLLGVFTHSFIVNIGCSIVVECIIIGSIL